MPDPVTLASIGTMTALLAAEESVKKLLASAPPTISNKLRHLKNRSNSRALYKKIAQVRSVKTIWQVDKEVDLAEFYFPCRVLIDAQEVEAHSLEDLPTLGGVVLQGMVGQGKSIFLRYICARELQGGERIPIFVELRRLSPTRSVIELLRATLEDLGLKLTNEELGPLLSTGRVVLMLDGFDEIDPSLVDGAISDLESLLKRFDRLRILVTSRPDSGIERSSSFRVIRLRQLATHDVPKLIDRLSPSTEAAVSLKKMALRKDSAVHTLLVTPLMVTLLVITYKSEQKIPESASDFYDGLFELMLSRHDRTKPGYVRKRKCPLGNRDMRRLFECFAYQTKVEGLLDGATTVYEDRISTLSNKLNIECSPHDYMEDICKCTGLVSQDGSKCYFIHRSVQEYYASCYVRSRPDESAILFYKQMGGGLWRKWSQELSFLGDIDKYRFFKHFLVDDITMSMTKLGLSVENGKVGPGNDIYKTTLQKIKLGLDPESGQLRVVWHGDDGVLGWAWRRGDRRFLDSILALATHSVLREAREAKYAPETGVDLRDKRVLNYKTYELFKLGILESELRTIVDSRIAAIRELLGAAKAEIEAQERASSMLSLTSI